MSRNRTENDEGDSNGDNSGDFWGTAAVVGGLAAAFAGGLYYLTQGSSTPEGPQPAVRSVRGEPRRNIPREPQRSTRGQPQRSIQRSEPSRRDPASNTMSDSLSCLLQKMDTGGRRGIPTSSIPSNPAISNLNGLLADIYVRYIALNNEEFELHYRVFSEIFNKIHKAMKEVDPYYNKYSSTVQFAGSHYDRLRINKPDEFDMDIVIGLPLNLKNDPHNPENSDIVLEPNAAGFLQLKMGVQFQRLHMRDGTEWLINKTAFEWKDERNYLLRSNFIDWFKGVVSKALNKFEVNRTLPAFNVDGVSYTVRKSESGPAMTLFIENKSQGFKLDVDLVPALKFPENRWPITNKYRNIPPGCNRGTWMVVPKPNKAGQNEHDMSRSWRIALHDQERGLMHDSSNMRQAIRLLKKLRDAQDMKKIASYYVKTLFFWEVEERRNDPNFWRKNPGELFNIMVKKFHSALVVGKIPYYWNKNNNLIEHVPKSILASYAAKLAKLLQVLEQPMLYKQVARYLLTPEEFREYNAKFLHI